MTRRRDPHIPTQPYFMRCCVSVLNPSLHCLCLYRVFLQLISLCLDPYPKPPVSESANSILTAATRSHPFQAAVDKLAQMVGATRVEFLPLVVQREAH